jgi:hypothetical protein
MTFEFCSRNLAGMREVKQTVDKTGNQQAGFATVEMQLKNGDP